MDDERIILDGITAIVDWAAAETVLAGTARNGLEAYDFIVQHQPHIVISDIKMPGMDGLQLAAKAAEQFPHIPFIMLSGFGEFDYAQTAMRYGVKHYLLKPSNEEKILATLKEAVAELKLAESREQFVLNMKQGLTKVLPHVKEQFLKEFVTNKTYGVRDWDYYRDLFNLDLGNRQVRLALVKLEGNFEFEHLFAVKNIAGDLLPHIVLSATVGDHVLLALEDIRTEELFGRLDQIRQTFVKYYRIELTIALSDAGEITEARSLYKQTLECLNHRFYLDDCGGLITSQDVRVQHAGEARGEEIVYDEEQLLLRVKAGHWQDVQQQIQVYFQRLADMRLEIQTVKSYVLQMYLAMIRLGREDLLGGYMQKLVTLSGMNTLQSIQSGILQVAEDITQQHYTETVNKHGAIVGKVKAIIEEQLGNPNLSLQWVASEMLYMNDDYLGKLFKKETGEKFTNYMMKARIAKAVELLKGSHDIKIFELAERLGFGDNPQYFSQVFKKYTGFTPSEFIKS